ncbi:unnamed protein product [Macrosiphum euphorbiae]|uniref:Transposase n=1 Tax=Macrosiphum euphorbiae TaxID=13131 RepID=A0AAV0Y7M1_9HEMI|nr:unnamed protein product [Macrosiphum euphorbiae]
MDVQTGKIIGFKLVKKLMVQGDLERYACGSLLNELVNEENCKIDIFLTDRHKGIRCDMRINHSNIEHEFDIWHISKSLMKRMKTLDKKYPDAFLWKTSISNHLWWSAQTCHGDGDLLVKKFTSILKHISNIHEWVEDGELIKCEHAPLSNDEQRNKLWINQNSESYFALKKIITAKDCIKDLAHAKHFIHTGRLESYHNVRLKYMPKRIHLKYNGMYIRSILAIIDHNSNLNKNPIGEKVVYSKSLRKYTIKTRFEPTKSEWRRVLLENIQTAIRNGVPVVCEQFTYSNKNAPKNIAPVTKPDLDDLKAKRFSRFSSNK